ncbi:uncharacterized protein STEHIDRAFT_153369 [Stereum hirsutum FP-91666 SS1]|uniref:uncharacterized protein n=1 Tax=Stereum hirsutum (strain FP-91666) TaxID=721885 RepID=UPI000440AA57|nr:uncharacterized protein STEHIDRAFT_153369 [Stereum hirsutum FP-91666 SS1]EIM89509.1 hypothetical protein STEHIDRAFT_153369 [Stereum hirsutum FP-91666 SS1]
MSGELNSLRKCSIPVIYSAALGGVYVPMEPQAWHYAVCSPKGCFVTTDPVVAKRSVEGLSLAQNPSFRSRDDALRQIEEWTTYVGPRAQLLYEKKRKSEALLQAHQVPNPQRKPEHQSEDQEEENESVFEANADQKRQGGEMLTDERWTMEASSASRGMFVMPTLESTSVTEWSDMSETLSSVSDMPSIPPNQTVTIDRPAVQVRAGAVGIASHRTPSINVPTPASLAGGSRQSSVVATPSPSGNIPHGTLDDRDIDAIFRLGRDNVNVSREVQYHLQLAVETAIPALFHRRLVFPSPWQRERYVVSLLEAIESIIQGGFSWFAIVRGRGIGVHRGPWDMIADRITDIEEGAVFKGFATYEEADAWFDAHSDMQFEVDV